MKKISNFVLALGFAGIVCAGSASAATPVTISFDGFCDGMTLTTANGLVGGTLAGCLTGIALGNKGIDYGLIPLDGTTGVVSNVQSSADGSTEILTYYLDFENGTWANYGTGDGSVPFLFNSGTFTVTGNGVKPNFSGPPSNVRQAKANALPFSHTASIAFTGFCDGLDLTFAGDLIGALGNGCEAGIEIGGGNTGTDFSIEPFGAGGSGVAANVGSNANGDGYLTTFFLDFANKTWSVYYTTDGAPVFLRTGTFTISNGSKQVFGNGPPAGKL